VPWRGPEFPGEFATLGYLVAEWIETHCVIPDRATAGQPLKLSDEQYNHLLWQYRLRPDARFDVDRPAAPFAYVGSVLVRSQKWGKGPFSAARICAQAAGPVLFAGWDANGEAVGMPWATPHIQVAAVAEDQTDNIWRALKPMIELGPAGVGDPGHGPRADQPAWWRPGRAGDEQGAHAPRRQDHVRRARRAALDDAPQRRRQAGGHDAPQRRRHGRPLVGDRQRVRPVGELGGADRRRVEAAGRVRRLPGVAARLVVE
jgi:hypothetical protein